MNTVPVDHKCPPVSKNHNHSTSEFAEYRRAKCRDTASAEYVSIARVHEKEPERTSVVADAHFRRREGGEDVRAALVGQRDRGQGDHNEPGAQDVPGGADPAEEADNPH